MAIKLQIRKKAGNVWDYYDVDKDETVSSSKQFMGTQANAVEFSQPYGNDFARFPLDEIAIYDDTASGTEEVYSTIPEFAARLKALGNPSFYRSGDVVIADFVSSDAGNIIIIGTDGKLYADGNVNGGTP